MLQEEIIFAIVLLKVYGKGYCQVRRFFISKENIDGQQARLTGSCSHHLRDVLRMQKGEKIILALDGLEYLAEIQEFSGDEVLCLLLETRQGQGEPPVEVVLLLGIPKGEKLELVIQKAVELGVSRMVVLETERSVVKLDRTKAERRLQRWQRISLEAAKQCQRSTVPQVEGVYKLSQYLEEYLKGEALFLVPWEDEETTGIGEVLKAHSQARRVYLLIGPEGGLSKEEVELAKAHGGIPVSLGPRILRTETAAIVALALVLYQLGDLN